MVRTFIDTNPSVRGIGPLSFDTGDGKTGTIRLHSVRANKHGSCRASITFAGKKKREFGSRRRSQVDAVMQVVEAKLPMLGPAEKTRIKKMIYERQSDRGVKDVRRDTAASKSPVGVFHQICDDDLPMSSICHASQEAWKHVADINGAMYHCWTRGELYTILQKYFPNT